MVDEVLDEALGVLAGTGPQYGPFGFVNHAPMVAEALVQLGRPDDVLPWVEQYRHRLEAAPARGRAMDEAGWREALGDLARFADWEAFFTARLAEAPWADVVETWATRMLPGLAADALHGVIRTAHAVRALAVTATPARLDELARGLALWAAGHQELPGTPGTPDAASGTLPSAAIGRVRRLTPEERGEPVSIVAGLEALSNVADFAGVVDLVDVAADPQGTLTDLIATFANVTLEQAHDPIGAIVFIHTVTGPASVRLLLPYLEEGARPAAVAHAWQAAAGIYAAFGAEPVPPVDAPDPAPLDPDDLVDRAVAGGDEHAIKYVEACVREARTTDDVLFLRSSHHAVGLLDEPA